MMRTAVLLIVWGSLGQASDAPRPPAEPKPRPEHEQRYKDHPAVPTVGTATCRAALVLKTTPTTITVDGWAWERAEKRDVRKERTYLLTDTVARGELNKWAIDRYAYRMADLEEGDRVELKFFEDRENGKEYVFEISIEARPGGRVPPSQRPGVVNLHRPSSEENVTTCPYHTGQNVTNDLKAGIKVADELLQLTGRLPLPRKDAPGRIPPAKK